MCVGDPAIESGRSGRHCAEGCQRPTDRPDLAYDQAVVARTRADIGRLWPLAPSRSNVKILEMREKMLVFVESDTQLIRLATLLRAWARRERTIGQKGGISTVFA